MFCRAADKKFMIGIDEPKRYEVSFPVVFFFFTFFFHSGIIPLMSKASDDANAVVYAAEQVLDLYGVQHTREQSRVMRVEGSAGGGGDWKPNSYSSNVGSGRWRPLYFGKWIDDNGTVHTSGRADLLARPRIPAYLWGADEPDLLVTVPLWIECKSGKGRLSPDQVAFKSWVESNGDFYLLIHNDINPLVDWLKVRNVSKQPKLIIHAEPLNTEALAALPCRHCKHPKEKPFHTGTIFACRDALGKVWSPKLTTAAKGGM
jgi:hypothetical protein